MDMPTPPDCSIVIVEGRWPSKANHDGRRNEAYQPAHSRNESLSSAACSQSCGLVSLGRGGTQPGKEGGQTHSAQHRLLGLPLVPCDGEGVLRERGDCQVMNERFINIKVDREERPDLDEIYMNAAQVMTGSGGWPMNVFLTPDLVPFHAGTYFPPEDREGMPGFPKILAVVSDYYRITGEKSRRSNRSFRRPFSRSHGWCLPKRIWMQRCWQRPMKPWRAQFDPTYGGFGGAPKFPSIHVSLFSAEILEEDAFGQGPGAWSR